MPAIKDFFNRIRDAVFGKKEIPRLEPGKSKDLILDSALNAQKMAYYEEPLNYNEYCKDFFSIPGNFDMQYDYVELITMMQENGSMQEYQKYLEYIKNNPGLYYPSKVHGVDHSSRVVLFAEMLCMLDNLSPQEKNLVMVAAQLHDIGREDDGKNFDHGLASKYKIEQLGLLRNFSDRDREIIEFAVESHSLEPDQIEEKLKTIPKRDRKDYEKILNYLQDADKLDRTRIANKGWGLDPNRLASDTAKRLVKVAHQNYWEYNNMMRHQDKINEQDMYGNRIVQYLSVVREKGYNITLEALSNIVAEYKPGTLEMLYSQGKIEQIFSYETFQKYKKEESFEERINPNRIDPDELFKDVTRRQQVCLMRETFNSDFMLYYNLKKNNPEAFDLFCYVDLDINEASIAGAVEVVRLNDLNKLNQKGQFFSMNDLIYFASRVTPEKYVEIVKSGKIEELYSSKYYSDEEIERVRANLQRKGISISEDILNDNFRLVDSLSGGTSDILQQPGIEKYSIPEIYRAVTKLEESKYRIRDGKTSEFAYDNQTILNLLKYSREIGLPTGVTEEQTLDFVENFAKNSDFVNDPRFIHYVTKKNKPFETKNISEILNYREFCANQVLVNSTISLEDAKSAMANALFTIDVPSNLRKRFEQEATDTLYYHLKYLPQSFLETEHRQVMDVMRALFESSSIQEFKNILYENKKLINSYNTEKVGEISQKEVSDFSKQDMVSELQETERKLNSSPLRTVIAKNGTPVQAKVLDGDSFFLATSTAMPKCSGRTSKILKNVGYDPTKARNEIYSAMLNTQMDPNEFCTSISSDKMLAHASSALQDQELIFAYVPQNAGDISIMGVHDLSTVKNNQGVRVTQKPTTSRCMKDFVKGTTEEHNEVVMSNLYPRYIVCYDQITDIAIAKRDALEQEYRAKGITQPIEILFIDAKGTYIPRIKSEIEQEHSEIRRKLESNQFTTKDFEEMFERKESNFALRNLQVMHSTSYRNDVWDDDYNRRLIRSMRDIFKTISERVTSRKAQSVEKHVSTLINRANGNSEYGSRFYDHSYANDLEMADFDEIKRGLVHKSKSYEMKKTQVQTQDESLDRV